MSNICTDCGEIIKWEDIMIVFEGLMYHKDCFFIDTGDKR